MADWAGPEPVPLTDTLREHRVVRVWGPLDDASVSRAAAELMALDATGDDPVQLFVASPGGPLHLGLSLADTIDLLGVPVRASCLGRVEGAAVLVAAVASVRQAAPHAQFHLCMPEVTASGNAGQLTSWAEQYRAEFERFSLRMAQACGRHLEHIEADLAQGRWLDARSAIEYGLVDELWSPGRGPGL